MGLDNIQNYMIGIVLMIVMVTSGVLFIGSFNEADTTLGGTTDITYFNQTLNKANEITGSVNEIKQSINDVSVSNTGALGWLNALIGSVFDGLRAIGGTLSFMDVAATESGELFGIPGEIVGLLILISIILIGFGIYAAVMRV